MKLLYVEDSAVDADLTRRRLRKAEPSAVMEVATTQREALDRLARPEGPAFDVVLLDMKLPDGNGLEVLAQIRALAIPVAVVIITGAGDEATAVAALKAGADDYVIKRDDYLAHLPLTLEKAVFDHRAGLIREQVALRESEERFRATFEQAAVGIAHVALDGRFLRVNRKLCEILGRASTDLQQMNASALIGGPAIAAARDRVGRLLAGEVGTLSAEMPLIRRDQSTVWANLTVSLARGLTGEPKHFIVVVEDISVRKRAEDALSRSETRFRTLFENAVYGMYLSDARDRFVEVNAALLTMLGCDSGFNLVGRPVSDLYVDPALAGVFAERCHRETMVKGLEAKWRCREAEPLYVRLSGRLTRDETGAPTGYEVIVENLSEQRALEAQLRQAQKMDAIGRLAGGVAHDFNNLLTAILGFCDLLLGQASPEDPSTSDVKEIRIAAERAAGLTRQLLSFSRKQVVAPRVVRLGEVVRAMEPMLRRLLGEDIELSIRAEGGHINADPGQIEQVIMNLSVNARDAMPKGGPLAIISSDVDIRPGAVGALVGLEPGAYVKLEVADEGIGMDPDTQAHLFEPFFTTKEQGKGTGLGLSTVHGIVGQAGGQLVVHSAPGMGSTFTIYFPRVPGIERPDAEQVAERPKRTGTETVLLVEDEEEVRQVVRRVLERQGYRMLVAKGAEAAIDICTGHEGPIHLIVSDVVMPHLSGPDLCRRLREIRPDVKVLYLSGYTDDKLVQNEVHDAVAGFLSKPFLPEALARKVRDVLDAQPVLR